MNRYNSKKELKKERLEALKEITKNKIIDSDRITEALSILIHPDDIVILEGDNQKQAKFLATALSGVNPQKVYGLNMIIPSVSLDEHLDLFEKGIAREINFAFAGPQSTRVAEMLAQGKLKIGNIHTYIELYARLFVDLIPDICLIAAEKADENGNLFTGANTEETPTLVEATAFKNGIVIAQVNELVQKVDRVDIPADWVDFIVVADEPFESIPLFTRDPRYIKDVHILMAMMVIKGIYAKHKVKRLNHGIGFNGAAIELLLPTYGEELGLKGEICTDWVLNPHPTLIPAIEKGWVKNICAFGGEVGTNRYVEARPDIFYTGKDGSMRSNRTIAQLAGLYGIDLFLGATLQMDYFGNSSTVTEGRLSGFGGAPNMGHDIGGRRHFSYAWSSVKGAGDSLKGGKKLVVQMLNTTNKKGASFVPELDAVKISQKTGMPSPPIMIYSEDITHVVTEQGIAYLYMAETKEEKREMLACISQGIELGEFATKNRIEALRKEGKIAYPEDLKIEKERANKNLLAAKNLEEIVSISEGLYEIPDSLKS